MKDVQPFSKSYGKIIKPKIGDTYENCKGRWRWDDKKWVVISKSEPK